MSNVSDNLVWFTGAPGSKWSGSANILQAIAKLNFNITDRSPEREYRHTGPTELAKSITHTGVYFGPGHGFGENFDKLDVLKISDVEDTIIAEWKEPEQGKLLVKSHFFSHHLDYIANTWVNSPIIMIVRPNHKCESGWFGAGGWDIKYPNYKPFYKDDETMKFMIAEHNRKIYEFCKFRNISLAKLNTDYLKHTFNWSVDEIDNLELRQWVDNHIMHTEGTDDVEIAIYNLHKL